MKKIMLLIPALAFLAACAHYHGTQVRTVTNGVETVTTEVKIGTLFDAKSELSKLNLSTTDKSQRQSLGGLNQESTSTNLVNLVEAAARGAAAGAGKGIVP